VAQDWLAAFQVLPELWLVQSNVAAAKALVAETSASQSSCSAMKMLRVSQVGMGEGKGGGWETWVSTPTFFVLFFVLAGLVRVGESERLG